MKFRSFSLLCGTLALAGCAGQVSTPGLPSSISSILGGANGGSSSTGRAGGPVALLVPLSGPLAGAGTALENAVKLGLGTGGPVLDVRDTGGTPQGAQSAAQAAIAAGDGLILGPLTGAEAEAVAPEAKAANVNVLAFSNTASIAAPGLWTLGITPSQQVSRVAQYAADQGRTQLAAVLPDNDFGHALGSAVMARASSLGEQQPRIEFYEPGAFSSLNNAIREIADYAGRGQGVEAQIKKLRDEDTAEGRAQARALSRKPIAPPPFNALFIGATDGNALEEVASFLPYYSAQPPQVQLLGPSLWAPLARAMGHNSVLNGALFAAPDNAARSAFDAKYQSAYGATPPLIAEIGFDAGAIARLAAQNGGYTANVLADPAGFTGVDGVLRLEPDGHVQRGLAVFQVSPGGANEVSPAPAQLPASPTS